MATATEINPVDAETMTTLRERITRGQERLEAAEKEGRETSVIRAKLEELWSEFDSMEGKPKPELLTFKVEPKGLSEVLRALDERRMRHADEIRSLGHRILEGNRRLEEARAADRDTGAIRRKLADLEIEARALREAYEVPWIIVEVLRIFDGLEAHVPEGSKLRLLLPGLLDLQIKIDGVPF